MAGISRRCLMSLIKRHLSPKHLREDLSREVLPGAGFEKSQECIFHGVVVLPGTIEAPIQVVDSCEWEL